MELIAAPGLAESTFLDSQELVLARGLGFNGELVDRAYLFTLAYSRRAAAHAQGCSVKIVNGLMNQDDLEWV